MGALQTPPFCDICNNTSPSRAWLKLNALHMLACLLGCLLVLQSALLELSLCTISVSSLCELSLFALYVSPLLSFLLSSLLLLELII